MIVFRKSPRLVGAFPQSLVNFVTDSIAGSDCFLDGCHKNQSGRVIMVEVSLNSMSYVINPAKVTSASTSSDQFVVIF